MDAKKEAALSFLLRSYERKRRNPFLRYVLPDFTPAHIGLIALSIVVIAGGFLVFPEAGGLIFICAAVPAAYVWWRSSFRTRLDERAEFIRSAERIGVAEIAAGDFYDAHAKKGVLM